MFRSTKAREWRQNLTIPELHSWRRLNAISFDGVEVGNSTFEGGGGGILATRDLTGGNEGPLMTIPRDVVLSRERVELQAKSDQWLREVLEATGDYGRTSRGAILIFLLQQATMCALGQTGRCGVANPFTDYIRSLPEELLPTFWYEDERALLSGTTLKPAVEAKLNSLSKEFDNLRSLTGDVPWCAKYWWLEEEDHSDQPLGLTLDDWLQVDAMYRSRALEFPGIGDAMVPCIDMCNHAADEATSALYETNSRGDAILLLRDGKSLKQGDEVTITYGDKKGACEMIFSYGFVEMSMNNAKELFLDLQIPEDDPLGLAKAHVSTSAPGVRIYDNGESVEWESDFALLLSVNEEDGLSFGVLQTIDGERELETTWKGQRLPDVPGLKGLLQSDPMWEVFQLRAITLILARVEKQLQKLEQPKEYNDTTRIRPKVMALAMELRALESELLRKAYASLRAEQRIVAESDTVKQYLADFQGEELDFT